MENILSLLESVDTSWITPSFTTLAMDMILAFVCGLGIFHLLLHFLPPNAPSTPLAERITAKKVERSAHSNIRKKIRIKKAYRGSRKKPKEDKVLISLLHSTLRRLVNAISFCQLLKQDSTVGESHPEVDRADQPPRQHTEESVAINLSLVDSSVPLKEQLLPKKSNKKSKIFSTVLLNPPASIESQMSRSASQPPESLTVGRCCSPPLATSHPSHPPDTVAYTPFMPHSRMVALQYDRKALETPQCIPPSSLASSRPNTSGINQAKRPALITPEINHTRRPALTIPGLINSSRPTSTTLGLDNAKRPSSSTLDPNNTCRPTYIPADLKSSCMATSNMPVHENSSRPTSGSQGLYTSNKPASTNSGLQNQRSPTLTSPGLENASRPTSTSDGLDHSSRPTSSSSCLNHSCKPASTTPGLTYSNRPTSTSASLEQYNRLVSGPSWSNIVSKTWCHSNSSHGGALQEHLSVSLQEASFWTGPIYRQIEAGELTFINPDIQEMLEFHITKSVELKEWKRKGKEKADDILGCMGSMLKSWSRKQTTSTSGPFWSQNSKSEQLSGHHQFYYQKVSGNHVQVTCSQFFWGLPYIHSESLVATVNMAQSALDPPTIIFNGLCPYIPIEIQYDITQDLISTKTLLDPSRKPQSLNTKMYDLQAPVTEIQTQASDPTTLPNLPCLSPRLMNNWASCSKASKNQLSFPPAVEHLEHHILKKHQESTNLPDRVKKSQEAFLELSSKSLSSHSQGSLDHLPGEIIDPELQEHLEQHLKKRFSQLHGQWPHKDQELLDLIRPQEELPGMGQAEVNETACLSTLTDEASKYPQRVSPKVSKTAQLPRDPCKDLRSCLGRVLKDLDRSPEGSLGKVVEIISGAEVETRYMRHPGGDTPSVALVGPGKKHLEGTLRIHSSKCKHIHNSKMTMERTSFHDLKSDKKYSQGPSFLDSGTQKLLQTHLTRCLVKHRWSLALRGLKIIRVFSRNKATFVPFQEPSNASLSFGDSRNNSLPTKSSVLGEPFKQVPEETAMKGDSPVKSTKNPPSALQLELLRATPTSNNSVPSEVSPTIHEDSIKSVSTGQSLRGRTWQCNTVVTSCTGKPESAPGLIRGMYQSTDNESPSSSRTTDKTTEYTGLGIHHCSAPGVVLQDCATGTLFQNCASEVVLAADILSSRASKSSCKTVSTTRTSTSHDKFPFLSREVTVPKISQSQEPFTSHIFGANNYRSPTHDLYHSQKRPAQASKSDSNEKKFGPKIKSFLLSIFTPKVKVKKNTQEKVKAPSAPIQSRVSAGSRVFMPQQVAEAQNHKTSAVWVPVEKHAVHHQCVHSKNLHEPSIASVCRHVCHHSIPTVESKIRQGNMNCVQQAIPKVHRQASTDKWMAYGCNGVQILRQPVYQAPVYQGIRQTPHVPGTPIHCPRHCPHRSGHY